jgi:hypothetical protein
MESGGKKWRRETKTESRKGTSARGMEETTPTKNPRFGNEKTGTGDPIGSESKCSWSRNEKRERETANLDRGETGKKDECTSQVETEGGRKWGKNTREGNPRPRMEGAGGESRNGVSSAKRWERSTKEKIWCRLFG